MLISLNHNKYAQIDDQDYDLVSKYKWYFNASGYARTSTPKKMYLHHLILTPKKGCHTDHINGDKLDNRRSNLRNILEAQNHLNQNLRSNNTSGYKGVSWDKEKKKWVAIITVYKKIIHIGRFTDKIEAAKAYNKAAIKYHGEFARLNEV